jgi:hypothetical protein
MKVKTDSQPMDIDDPKVHMDEYGEVVMPHMLETSRNNITTCGMLLTITETQSNYKCGKTDCAPLILNRSSEPFVPQLNLFPQCTAQKKTFPKTSYVARFLMLACRRLRKDIR